MVLPLHEDQISVSKRKYISGRLQVSTVTQTREQLVDELLTRETCEVERVPVGKPVDAMPAVREEGDTIVVPIVEEVLEIRRHLVLKEEVRIRRVHRTERFQERVLLLKQDAVITRFPADAPAAGTGPDSGVELDNKKV